jgi:hypothetical protein
VGFSGSLGLLIIACWYFLYAFGADSVAFERAVLGMLLGLALVTSDRGKEK